MATDDEPPVAHVHPATLAAFEDVVLEGLASLQAQEKEELARLHEDEERRMTVRDRVDIVMILLGFIITAAMIWAHMDNWAPATGPIPIAGVAVRRVFRL